MVDEPILSCLLCGKRLTPEPTAMDQIQAAKNDARYICPTCAHKVRMESDANL
jgi:DNA-directed RNA polymerase subunit RPC12/RpoP